MPTPPRSAPRSLTTAAALLALLAAAPPAQAAPGQRAAVRNINWAGYDTTGPPGTFDHVEARWTQPSVDCTPGDENWAIFWVGLDGAQEGDTNVEQTGSGAHCETDGSEDYYVWYEMFPEDPVLYNDPIRPGDDLQAEVRALDDGRFELVLRDFTQKWNHFTYARPRNGTRAVRTSAEVLAEVPGPAGHRLADFGRVRFTDSLVNGRPIGERAPKASIMYSPGSDTVRALPSPLTGGGRNFTVTWKAH
ncbi:G1 family glutamic endopeptidase [Kitasatospora viridis]|uniref:Peptidase A4-like protein n=1 Tax=Kitasatospora viridis TaxID=281105 RepID=A0A561T6P2_9ACTN|nr:G1 family glutamic endopeptidase [Kitasatospora viridis]TWF82795.1 peptidase A4-like protein [Kitasatospora viridis]